MGLKAVEWRAGAATYLRAWEEMGGSCWVAPAPVWGQHGESALRELVPDVQFKLAQVDVCFTSLTQDKEGQELERLASFNRQWGADLIVADYPRGAEVKRGHGAST